MEARYYAGDDNRDGLSVPICECGAELYPEEVEAGECRRCTSERAEAEADQREVA